MAGPSGSTPNGYPFPTPDDTVDYPRDMEALARALDPNASAIIVGEIRTFGLAAAPARWLACDGSTQEQSAFPELFQALGGRFNTGGESSTQFRLPDLRGRAIVGSGAGAGLTNRAIAARWGEESHVLASSEMPSHAHGVNDPGHGHSVYDPGHTHDLGGNVPIHNSGWSSSGPFGGSGTGQNAPFNNNTAVSNSTATLGRATAISIYGSPTGITLAVTGGGGGHNNSQPSIALLVCIFAGR